MPLVPTNDVAWPVNLADPVARHPLNDKRIGWWLTLPNWEGGRQWYDLLGLYHGTLQQMTPASTNGWRTSVRPGGFAHLTGAGASTDGYVTLMPATAAPLTTAGSLTIGCWFRTAGTTNSYPNLVGYGTLDATHQGFTITVQPAASGNSIYVNIYDSTGLTQAIPANNTGTDNAWHRAIAVLSRAAGNVTLYLDARQVAQATISFNTGTIVPVEPFEVLRRMTAASLAASIDDVFIASRAWSVADVWDDYDLSRRGYPGVLNRLAPGPRAAAAPAVAAPASHHYRRRRAG